ncbi:MAG: response regulator [Clostridiales bacterium]|nr:response regulator [Clostridiales bacterium]
MGAKILLVDDDMMSRKLAQRLLEKKGYEVTAAESGQRCLEILREQKFDLLLLDWLMPEMDGMETFEKVKADGSYADLPVIFLTGESDEGAQEKAIAAGAKAYLQKPFVPQDAYECIEKVLGL